MLGKLSKSTLLDETKVDQAFYTILLAGLLIRLWHINWGLPAVYEEAMPLGISWQFWNWGHPGFDFHPRMEFREHFFVYPAFTFYLQFLIQSLHYAVGYLFGIYSSPQSFQQAYIVNPSAFIIIGRLTTVAFDIGIIVVVFKLGRSIANTKTALLAAALVAINVLHVKQSHLINVDTPTTFFVILTLLFCHRIYLQGNLKLYLLAGMSAGLATASKYNGCIVIAVIVLVHFLRAKSISKAVRLIADRKLILSLGASLLAFLLFNPYILVYFKGFLHELLEVEGHVSVGHLGITPGANGFYYYFAQSLPQNMGWTILAASVLTSIVMIARLEKRNFVLLLFPIVYIGLIGSLAVTFDRYILPAVPVLILVAAIGIMRLFEFVEASVEQLRKLKSLRAYQYGTGFVLFLIVGWSSLSATYAYQKTFSLPDTRVTVKDWIVKNVWPGSAIATGPFLIDLSKDPYALLTIPFNAGATEQTLPFYDARWYEDLDLVITSDYDYARYLREPERFKEFLRYYDTLRTHWTLAYEIVPTENQNGSSFWLYRPPSTATRDQFDSSLVHRLEGAGETLVLNFVGKLGLIEASKGKPHKCEQLLRIVLIVDPSNESALKELASIYSKEERYEEVLAVVNTYLSSHPQDAAMTALMGESLLYLNRVEDAETVLIRAIKLDGHLESAYIDLSILYAGIEDRTRLKRILMEYHKILPSGSDRARVVAKQLESLQ